MRIDRGRFRTVSLVILVAHAVAIGAFLVSRPPLPADHWAMLDRHRSDVKETSAGLNGSFSLNPHSLNVVLARRPVGGGWESAPVGLFQIINLPAYLAALTTFDLLQAKPGGTSRIHSDAATAVFAAVALIQWSLLALLLSKRRM
ncbi:MAG TPA: hypothetical protein VE974_06985 [Thermoanaerobaculia bacterium]|nr:hypothetical protein [Thermoanaerobaculia bacterium]